MLETRSEPQISGDTDMANLPSPDYSLPEQQQTNRIDLTDEYGTLIGYRRISTGEFDQWIENFDLDDRRTSWLYTNSDGYQQNGSCTDLLDDSGESIGERSRTVFLSPGGYEEEAIEIYDSAGNLLSSTHSTSDGFRSSLLRTPGTEAPHPSGLAVAYGVSSEQYSNDELQHSSTEVYSIEDWLLESVCTSVDGSLINYTLIGLRADDGSISGYEGLWEFTDADGSMTTQSDFYDAMLLPVVTDETRGGAGSSSDPETGKPAYFNIEQNFEVRRDDGEPPIVEEPVMQITDSPLVGTPPGITMGQTAVSDTKNLDLKQRRHHGARHAELTGEGDLNLNGNRLDNVLIGNAGDNRIAGGRGIDECRGGAGIDGFVLISKRGSHDWLTDFNPEEDDLLLRGKGMRRLFKGGELREGVVGDMLIWDEGNKTLLFDPDGSSGTRDPIPLAIIPGLEVHAVTGDLFIPG